MLQSELAFAAGVTAPMLSAYETGKQRPSFATLDKLLLGLGCNAADLASALQEDRDQLPPSPTRATGWVITGTPAPRRGRHTKRDADYQLSDVSAEDWLLLEAALPEMLRLIRTLRR